MDAVDREIENLRRVRADYDRRGYFDEAVLGILEKARSILRTTNIRPILRKYAGENRRPFIIVVRWSHVAYLTIPRQRSTEALILRAELRTSGVAGVSVIPAVSLYELKFASPDAHRALESILSWIEHDPATRKALRLPEVFDAQQAA
jgi:hypothetical protein